MLTESAYPKIGWHFSESITSWLTWALWVDVVPLCIMGGARDKTIRFIYHFRTNTSRKPLDKNPFIPSLSSMEPTPTPSPDIINFITSREGLNLNDLHTILCDCGERRTTQQTEVDRLKEEMGPDYLLSRVDVVNLQHKFKHIEKKIKGIVVLVVGLVVVMFIFMILMFLFIIGK